MSLDEENYVGLKWNGMGYRVSQTLCDVMLE